MIVYGIVNGKKRNLTKRIRVSNVSNRIFMRAPDCQKSVLSPRIKICKMKWKFRKDDPDFNPSVPHGHSLDGKYKLELWTGNIIEVSNNTVKKVAKKQDMINLYNYPGFVDFVEECRKAYQELNPRFNLQPLKYPAGFICNRVKKCNRSKYKYDGIIVELSVISL